LWPAGFDPTVVPGVPAPVGSIGMLVDGSAGWVKWYDGGDTAWVSFYDLGLMQYTFAPLLAQAGALGTLAAIQVALSDLASKQAALDAVAADQVAGARGLTQVSGTFGADAAIWNLGALACDTKGGFSLSLSTILKGTGGATSLQLAINGAQANLAITGSLLGPASIAPFCNLMVGGAPVAPTSVTELVVRCDAPESSNGRRLLSCVSTYGGTYVFDKQIVLLPGLGEVTSVGIYIETPGAVLIDGTNSHYTLTRRIAP
jgi:hypothetical protein